MIAPHRVGRMRPIGACHVFVTSIALSLTASVAHATLVTPAFSSLEGGAVSTITLSTLPLQSPQDIDEGFDEQLTAIEPLHVLTETEVTYGLCASRTSAHARASWDGAATGSFEGTSLAHYDWVPGEGVQRTGVHVENNRFEYAFYLAEDAEMTVSGGATYTSSWIRCFDGNEESGSYQGETPVTFQVGTHPYTNLLPGETHTFELTGGQSYTMQISGGLTGGSDGTTWYSSATTFQVDFSCDWELHTVPEPTTGGLVGLAAFGLLRQRRR